jgi:A/G-specific adenine glycosylase
MVSFAARLVAWHRQHGRHDLPWQRSREPYPIWVSEIMLQQTQVATVIPYYRRFLERFPDLGTLAAAPLEHVLTEWSGLGYYSRARNLHRAAQAIVRDHGGRFPTEFEAVRALPGVGRSTAAAICAFAYGQRRAILDGNVKRVLARYFGVRGYPGDKRVETALWSRADSLLPRQGIADYTQALMDLGAGLCTRVKPGCKSCPVVADCVAYSDGLVEALPARKPKKALPQRRTVMLVLEHAGRVLLERRPEHGIWGGLWCLPECTPEEELQGLCARRFGARVGCISKMAEVPHGFTHFRLTIDPRHLTVAQLLPRAMEPELTWMPVEEAIAAALPAPVRRILAALRSA